VSAAPARYSSTGQEMEPFPGHHFQGDSKAIVPGLLVRRHCQTVKVSLVLQYPMVLQSSPVPDTLYGPSSAQMQQHKEWSEPAAQPEVRLGILSTTSPRGLALPKWVHRLFLMRAAPQ
jgi:hypothetical protein